MIAKEFIVKLGFTVDQSKFNAFSSMITNIRQKAENIKLSIAKTSLNEFDRKASIEAEAYKSRIKMLDERQARMKQNALGGSIYTDEQWRQLANERLTSERQYRLETIEREKERRKLLAEQEKQVLLNNRRIMTNTLIKLKSTMRTISYVSAGILGGAFYSGKKTIQDILDPKSKNTYTQQEKQTAKSFSQEQQGLNQAFASIKASVLVALLPPLTKVIRAFKEWLIINKELIKTKIADTFKTIGIILSNIANIIFTILKPIAYLIDKFDALKYVIGALVAIAAVSWIVNVTAAIVSFGKAFQLLSVIMLQNPIIAIVTAITAALTLLIDEIYTTIKGGDSLLNDFFNSKLWKAAIGIMQPALDMIKSIGNYVSYTITKIKEMYNYLFGNTKKLENNTNFLDTSSQLLSYNNEERDRIRQRLAGNEIKFNTNQQDLIANAKNRALMNGSKSVTSNNTYSITVNADNTNNNAQDIAFVIKNEIQKYDEQRIEQSLNAIGVR